MTVTQGFRLEAGVGAAGEGDGRSVNADLAATIGTRNLDQTLNYYTSFRLVGSHGCTGVLHGIVSWGQCGTAGGNSSSGSNRSERACG